MHPSSNGYRIVGFQPADEGSRPSGCTIMISRLIAATKSVVAGNWGKDLTGLSDKELVEDLSTPYIPEWRCTACNQECVTIHDLECGGENRHAACPLAPIDATGKEIDFEEWKKIRGSVCSS